MPLYSRGLHWHGAHPVTTRLSMPRARTASQEIVIVAPRTPRAAAPRRFLDDKLDGLQPPTADFVMDAAHADEPLAVARDEPLRARHAGTQRQSDFHRALPHLNARAGSPVHNALSRSVSLRA